MSALTPVGASSLLQKPVSVTAIRSADTGKVIEKRPRYLYFTLAIVGFFILIAIAISSWLFLVRTPYDSAMAVSFWQYAVYWFLRGISETAAALLLTLFVFRVLMRHWLPRAARSSIEQVPLRHFVWTIPWIIAAVIAFGPIGLLILDNGSLTTDEIVSVTIEILSAVLVGGMLWLFLWTQVRKQVVQLSVAAQMAAAAAAKVYVDEHTTEDKLLAIKLNQADQHLGAQPVVAEVCAKGVRVFDTTDTPQKQEQLAEHKVDTSIGSYNAHSTLIPVTVTSEALSAMKLEESRVIAAYQAEVLTLTPRKVKKVFGHPAITRRHQRIENSKPNNECYGLTVHEGKHGIFVTVEALAEK